MRNELMGNTCTVFHVFCNFNCANATCMYTYSSSFMHVLECSFAGLQPKLKVATLANTCVHESVMNAC